MKRLVRDDLNPWLIKLATDEIARISNLFSYRPWKAVYYQVNGKRLTSALYSRKEVDPTRKTIDLFH